MDKPRARLFSAWSQQPAPSSPPSEWRIKIKRPPASYKAEYKGSQKEELEIPVLILILVFRDFWKIIQRNVTTIS